MERTKEKIRPSLHSKIEKHIQSLKKICESKSFDDNTDSRFGLNVNKCLYCSKMFCTSQFLLKHILRRHSDDLVLLFEKLFNITKTDANFVMPAHNELLNFISNEFSKLRNELELMKYPFTSNKEGQDSLCPTFVKYPNSQSLSRSDAAKHSDELILELNNLKTTVLKTEAIVQDLEVQLRESATSAKSTTDNDMKQSDMLKQLQNSLVIEMQSIVSRICSENELILSKHVSDFHQEIERLEYLIKSNSEKIENSKSLQEMEKKLENEIQFFLNCNKAKKEKLIGKKHSLSVISKNADKLKKTGNSTPNLSNSLSILDSDEKKSKKETNKNFIVKNFKKNSGLQGSLIKNQTCSTETTKTFERGLEVISTPNLSSIHEENDLCEKNIELFESTSLQDSSPNAYHIQNELKESDNAVPSLIEGKLKSLGILSGTEKLSCHDFETKMKLLQADTDILSKKYPSFVEIRKRLSSCADDIVYLKRKGEKLKFPLKRHGDQHSKIDSSKKVTFQTHLFSNKLDVDEHTDETLVKEFYNKDKVSTSNKTEQVLIENINTKTNSAASLKLIKCTNRTLRKLPNFPLKPTEELSSYSSPFDSENESET